MSRNHDLRQLSEKMDANEDWVHDKFRAESPDRKENAPSNGSRRGDFYNGKAMRLSIDSYKPGLVSESNYKDDTHAVATRTPMSQDMRGYNSHSVDKPTVYQSVLQTLIEKAYGSGISSDAFVDMYYNAGKKATDEKPEGSSYWLLWRQECITWKKLCM